MVCGRSNLMKTLTWTDDRVAELKRLWSAGLSASEVANSLGGLTRNAVIGKVHRLHLSGRKTTPNQGPPRTRAPQPKPEPMMKVRPKSRAKILADVFARPVAPLVDLVPEGQRVSFIELTPALCHWPIGDPVESDFHFCGGSALPSLPYCASHCRIAYQPTALLRRIRPSR